MHSPTWLPAGVPPGLTRLRAHIAAFFAGAPLLFLGVVLGIAVVFRLAVGAVKPAVAAEEALPVAAPTSSAAARPEPRPAAEVGESPSSGTSPARREAPPPARGRAKHRRPKER